MFPGLIFRMSQPKLVILVFSSGKLVLTGAKEREQVYEAYSKIKHVLTQHKNDDVKARQPSYADQRKQ
jgi:transcription initiation factor TFIID TATA-box-binding protein